mmetsp:Transcript_36021/g.52797  ORF Transcript_36021/g.52797 Transcript_36021/m.52797 type:complete len:831 (-) Transcript_36021:1423-3915(-)
MSAQGTSTRPSYNPPLLKDNHPKWYPPTATTTPTLLRVSNSLTGSVETFVPGDTRKVLWYTCGPTVYDVSHVGHARAYLTFDILRRIMEDYFQMDILYQINTTDVDDKIILRARRNALLDIYVKDTSTTLEKALSDATNALQEEIEASDAKTLQMEETVKTVKGGREKKEAEELLKVQRLKHSNLLTTLSNLEEQVAKPAAALPKDATAAQKSELLSLLVQIARDPLSAKLDIPANRASLDINAVCDAHARKYERSYMDDMDALGVRPPDVLTRVTEYIPKIVTFIEEIVKNGFAYESGGSVYLDLMAYEKAGFDYRKLKPCGPAKACGGEEGEAEATTEAEMEEGEGALADTSAEKRHPNDFALWKTSKPGEPTWSSPWGEGRPGWHIECSVVATDILGPNLDIHAGGEDLKFPHHDNEIAQTEARYASQYGDTKQWCNFFFHAGHLHIKGLKMSKSLKNFITIGQALEKHSARSLRMLFLLQKWDQPMTFSDQTLDDAKSKEASIVSFFHQVKELARRDYLSKKVGYVSGEDGVYDRELASKLLDVQTTVHEALCDNFDTPKAMEAMLELVSAFNVYVRKEEGEYASTLLSMRIARYLTKMFRMLGLTNDADSFGLDLGGGGEGGGDLETTLAPYLDVLVDFREEIRQLAFAHKGNELAQILLAKCDDLRDDKLVDAGVALEDRPGDQKALWKLSSPDVLRKEVQERKERALEAAIRKLEVKVTRIEKDVQAAQDYLSVTTPFGPDEYGSYDEASGMPLTTKDGEVLGKGPLKKAKKKLDAFEKKRADFLKKKVPGDGEKNQEDVARYLVSLESELKETKDAVNAMRG